MTNPLSLPISSGPRLLLLRMTGLRQRLRFDADIVTSGSLSAFEPRAGEGSPWVSVGQTVRNEAAVCSG